ncbi:MAG TPA: ribosomal protein S18-alanine N-acetyltransferase [Dehalococcoidia bacterium]|nr:ribosomal protein S18-alanine N-acetyltransferase [Dehalococcoidia bacterium]
MEIEREAFPTMWPRTAFQKELEQNRLARYLVATQVRQVEPELKLPPEFQDLQPSYRGLAGFLDGLRSMVAGDEGEELPAPDDREELVVGFIGIWLMVGEAHIVSIAVREDYRGQHIGELLVIAAISLSLENGFSRVSLECRVSNYIALSLYEKYNFQRVGVRPRYYSDNHEDAYIMVVEGLESPEFQERFRRLQDEHQNRCGVYELHL